MAESRRNVFLGRRERSLCLQNTEFVALSVSCGGRPHEHVKRLEQHSLVSRGVSTSHTQMEDVAVAEAEEVDSCEALAWAGQLAEASNPVGRRGFCRTRLRRLAELPARRRQTSFRSHANSAAMSHRPVWSLWVRSFTLSGESASSGYIKQSVD